MVGRELGCIMRMGPRVKVVWEDGSEWLFRVEW